MEMHLFSSARQVDRRTLLPENMSDLAHQQLIHQALADPIARIPKVFQTFYYQYQNLNQRHFLKQANYFAQFAFLIYFFADLFVIPDLALVSGIARVGSILSVILFNYFLFKYVDNIRLLDLILPSGTIASAFIWFELLIHSSSPLVYTYQYASVILIVLGNLSIQIHFRQSLITSLLISAAILQGVFRLNQTADSIIFLLIYSPILLFSFYISWNNTLNGRRNFLRSLLDEWSYHKLNSLAHTDELTQLNNRRQFVYMAERRVIDPQYQSSCLILFDVDKFKRINDEYGHDVGDIVLQHIAQIARQEMRSDDILARFGGEEFIALLAQTRLTEAEIIAERLRKSIAAAELKLPNGLSVKFTVSIGIAEFDPTVGSLQRLIKQADIALYMAKKNGRNQIVKSKKSA
jgi:diguanylate cyclase (GGDEF)-like protein